MPDISDNTVDALTRRIDSLATYLASLERRIDAAQTTQMDERRERLIREIGRERAGELVAVYTENMIETAVWLRETIARLQAQRAEIEAQG